MSLSKIRVFIADDHGLVRAGLRALLEMEPDMEVVGEAADGVAVVEECRRAKPDVVLMDLSMPGRGGIRAIQDLIQTCEGVAVLVVTMHEDPTWVRQAVLAGASGYVAKISVATELFSAIRAVHKGLRHISPALAAAVCDPKRSEPPPPHHKGALQSLTAREREVVTEVALGHTTVEIAKRLHISENTVETHRKHIANKLALRSRADLVRFALEYGLISP